MPKPWSILFFRFVMIVRELEINNLPVMAKLFFLVKVLEKLSIVVLRLTFSSAFRRKKNESEWVDHLFPTPLCGFPSALLCIIVSGWQGLVSYRRTPVRRYDAQPVKVLCIILQ